MLQTSSPPGCLCAFIPLYAHPYSMHPFTSKKKKKNSYRDNTENTEKILPRGSKHPPYSEPSSSRLGLGSPRETNEAILIQIPSPHPLTSRYQGRRGAHKAFGVSWLNAPSPGSHKETETQPPTLRVSTFSSEHRVTAITQPIEPSPAPSTCPTARRTKPLLSDVH